jgi:hypothetical protein
MRKEDMMKKQYMAPATMMVEIGCTTHLLSGSGAALSKTGYTNQLTDHYAD